MRILFLILVLLNVAYFGWNYYHPQTSTNPLPPLAKDATRSVLLHELESNSEASSYNPADVSFKEGESNESAGDDVSPEEALRVEISTGDLAAAETINEQAVTENTLDAEVQVNENISEHLVNVEMSGDEIVVEQTLIEEEIPEETTTKVPNLELDASDEETQRRVEPDTIAVRGESDGDNLIEVVTSASSENIAQQQLVLARNCFTLGPFYELEMAENLAKRLESMDFEVRQRNITQPQPSSYWVYLPPRASQEDAVKITKNLARKGIKDYFVVTEGDTRNAISLGLFNWQSGARRRFQKIKSLGYEPELEVRYRDKLLHWLDYDEMEDHTLPPGVWQSLTTEGGSVQRVVRNCE